MRLLALACALTAVASCRSPDPEACSERLTNSIAIFAGSRVRANDAIAAGAPRRCDDEPELGAALAGALRHMPPGIRPDKLVVHLNPRWETRGSAAAPVVFHEPSRSLLVERAGLSRLDRTVWLHELVHASADGARPASPLSKRLHRAIEEGIADYVAATLAGSSRVGASSGGEVRDLERPPRVGASEYARLGLGAPFPAHAVGHALAAELYRADPRPRGEDLLTCFDDRRAWPSSPDTPKALIDELVARCNVQARRDLTAALAELLPAELLVN